MSAPPTDRGWNVDPEDWQPEPPPVKIDDLFVAEACVTTAKQILDDRVAKMKRARQLMRRAYEAVTESRSEVDRAIDLLEVAMRDWARVKQGKHEVA